MFILKKGHQPGVYVPLRALFLVLPVNCSMTSNESFRITSFKVCVMHRSDCTDMQTDRHHFICIHHVIVSHDLAQKLNGLCLPCYGY